VKYSSFRAPPSRNFKAPWLIRRLASEVLLVNPFSSPELEDELVLEVLDCSPDEEEGVLVDGRPGGSA